MSNNDRKFSKYLLYECDVCGFKFFKRELIKQNGLWKCRVDYDSPDPAGDQKNRK